MADIVYRFEDGIYFNITNKCPCRCAFCIRDKHDAIGEAKRLFHDTEPTWEEIKAAIDSFDFGGAQEAVFCGYGEPTCRLDTVLETARELKKLPVCPLLRINTNGLSDLVNGKSTAESLCEVMDIISVSLNAGTEDEYMKVTRPKYPDAFEAMQKFTADCVKTGNAEVIMSVVDVIPQEQIEASREIAEKLGAKLRVRSYES